jgi:hypothetical protein
MNGWLGARMNWVHVWRFDMVSIDKIGENVRFSLLGRQNACVRSLAVAHVSLHPHPYCGGSTLEELRGAFETEKGLGLPISKPHCGPSGFGIWRWKFQEIGGRVSRVSRPTSPQSSASRWMDG